MFIITIPKKYVLSFYRLYSTNISCIYKVGNCAKCFHIAYLTDSNSGLCRNGHLHFVAEDTSPTVILEAEPLTLAVKTQIGPRRLKFLLGCWSTSCLGTTHHF